MPLIVIVKLLNLGNKMKKNYSVLVMVAMLFMACVSFIACG